MNVYQRLSAARADFHKLQIKKTGLNKFAGYSYFELADFMPHALRAFADNGLIGTISFGDVATLKVTNIEKPDDYVAFFSPLAEANLRGCHPVQNLGAVQSYIRRYLWVNALEIIEQDAIDSSEPEGKKRAPVHKPTDGAVTAEDRQAVIRDVAMSIIDHMRKDDTAGAYEEYIGITDPEEKTALWGLLEAPVRRQLKEYGSSIKD